METQFILEIDRFCEWAGKWQMEFNVEKRSILTVSRNNPSHNYCLNGTPLSRSRCERDLGLLVSSDLHPRAQCIRLETVQIEYWDSFQEA